MIGRSVRQEAERANPAPGENRLTSLNRATNEKQATEQATARPNEPKNEIHSYFHSPENEICTEEHETNQERRIDR